MLIANASPAEEAIVVAPPRESVSYAFKALGRAERSGSVELNRKNIDRKEYPAQFKAVSVGWPGQLEGS